MNGNDLLQWVIYILTKIMLGKDLVKLEICMKTKTMVFSEELERTDQDSPGLRTAKILNLIVNTIEPEIQLTNDIPKNHTDYKVNMLLGVGRLGENFCKWEDQSQNGVLSQS